MKELPHHESRSVEDMKLFLGQSLGSTLHEPKLFYDARRAEVRGSQEGDVPTEKANWLAELTIQHHGSAYEDYQSVTKDEAHRVLMYVQAKHLNHDFLVVGHQLDSGKFIVHPARLSLQDLVGYRAVEKIE